MRRHQSDDQDTEDELPSESQLPTTVPHPEKTVDVALAQYTALRSELAGRVNIQAALVGVALTGAGVIFSLALSRDGNTLLLTTVPPFSLVINVLHMAETYRMGNHRIHTRAPVAARCTIRWNVVMGNVTGSTSVETKHRSNCYDFRWCSSRSSRHHEPACNSFNYNRREVS